MFPKTFLTFWTAIAATSALIPTALAAQPSQQSVAPAWIMKFEQAANVAFDREKREIRKVINKSYSSINAGDSAGFLSTLSSNSAEYQEIVKKPSTIPALKLLGLVFSVQQLDFIQVSSNQAEVKVKLSAKLGTTGIYPELERLKRESGTRIGKDGSVTTTSVKTSGGFNKSQVSTGTIKLGKVNGRWLIVAMLSNKFQSTPGSEASSVSSVSGASQTIRPADRQIFQQVFIRHLHALNQENLSNYLATLDPKSPKYSPAKTATQKLFKDYDLKYEWQSVDVISLGQQDAVVRLTATVKKIKGRGFTDSQMVTLNTVKKTNGQWRIYDTQVESISAISSPKTKVARH
jgi:hypothetical protein